MRHQLRMIRHNHHAFILSLRWTQESTLTHTRLRLLITLHRLRRTTLRHCRLLPLLLAHRHLAVLTGCLLPSIRLLARQSLSAWATASVAIWLAMGTDLGSLRGREGCWGGRVLRVCRRGVRGIDVWVCALSRKHIRLVWHAAAAAGSHRLVPRRRIGTAITH